MSSRGIGVTWDGIIDHRFFRPNDERNALRDY